VTRRASRRTRSADADFAHHLTTEGAAHPAAGPGPVPGVQALLAVQEIADPTAEGRHAVDQGHDLLDHLDELRHALLIGTLPKDRLHRLAAMVADRRGRANDPRLAQILGDIDLRVRVELAKFGM